MIFLSEDHGLEGEASNSDDVNKDDDEYHSKDCNNSK